MRIFIITMDDPVQTHRFIKHIVQSQKHNIVGMAVSKGDRLTIGKKNSKILYVISLFLIMGPIHFLKNSTITMLFKVRRLLSSIKLLRNPSILCYAQQNSIPSYSISSPNNKEFIQVLKELNIDIIINQSQSIIKKELLEIPRIGVINRHNALLPKNRGRLTPFWVLFKGEPETGVSIHFVNEGIDSGDIIIQEKYTVAKHDTFNSLVKKNYEIAPKAMIAAIEKLERGDYSYISNSDELATYNTIPTLKEAWLYRKRLMLRRLGITINT